MSAGRAACGERRHAVRFALRRPLAAAAWRDDRTWRVRLSAAAQAPRPLYPLRLASPARLRLAPGESPRLVVVRDPDDGRPADRLAAAAVRPRATAPELGRDRAAGHRAGPGVAPAQRSRAAPDHRRRGRIRRARRPRPFRTAGAEHDRPRGRESERERRGRRPGACRAAEPPGERADAAADLAQGSHRRSYRAKARMRAAIEWDCHETEPSGEGADTGASAQLPAGQTEPPGTGAVAAAPAHTLGRQSEPVPAPPPIEHRAPLRIPLRRSAWSAGTCALPIRRRNGAPLCCERSRRRRQTIALRAVSSSRVII